MHSTLLDRYIVLRFNSIAENNIDRISYGKHGIQSTWDALPGSDKTTRMTPQGFLGFLRGKCNIYFFVQFERKHAMRSPK